MNTETGEIKPIESRNGDAQYGNKQRWRGRQADFTASNMRNIHEVYDALTPAQCGYLMRLQCNVGYENGTLINSDKTPMKKTDMIDELQLKRKRSTFYDFFAACVDNDIIREQADGSFAVNDRYHFKGAFNDVMAVKSYTAKIKRVYSEVKAADIGLIYRMLPYVHYDTNALCENPFEQNAAKIRWFSRQELAKVIDVDATTLSRRFPRMKFGGEYVVARLRIGAEPERYTLNPNVFYRKDSAPDKSLVAQFSVGDYQLETAK